jgi:hypothetical protein
MMGKSKDSTFKKDTFSRKLLLLGSFFLISLFWGNRTLAYSIENYQENVEDRFVISPANLELSLAPGESSSQKMIIVNRLGRTALFKIDKEDFIGSDDPEKITTFLGDESGGITSAKDWISPEINEATLSQGDRLTLPIEIKVPESAKAGSHYAAVFASVPSASNNASKDKVNLVSRVGMLILITVSGENKESGKITSFDTDKNFYRNGPVNFTAVFHNTGNVYQRVRGEVAIKNMMGAEVGHVSLRDWIVLSNASRAQTTSWDKKWLMGRYTAHLTLFYGLGGSLKTETDVVFYAFPWQIALAVFLALIVIFYLYKYLAGKFEIKRKEDGTRQ